MQHFLSARQNIKPATLSVMIQCAVFAMLMIGSFIILVILSTLFNTAVTAPLPLLVILQGAICAFVAHGLGLASWWRWIHFGFPLAIWLMSGVYIPNQVYLVGFIITASVYWGANKTQVPFYPSLSNVWREVGYLIAAHQSTRMIDIGSGLGDMAMFIAKTQPQCKVEGVEIAPLPWVLSYVRAKLKGSRAQFTLGNYHRFNFAHYDLIFAYLSPAAMPALWQKARAEMRAGSLLVSYEFEIAGQAPSQKIFDAKRKQYLYVWKM